MTAKPAIVVYGNCAGEYLARQLRATPAVMEQYDVYWFRSFVVEAPGDEPIDLSVLSRCAAFLEQVGNFRDDIQRRGGTNMREAPIPANCRRVRFPPLFMNTLWPFATLDPRSESWRRPWMVEGPYPAYVSNRLILEIMQEEKNPDRVYERFTSIRIRDRVDLDRLHALTMAKIRGLDRDSDLPMGEFIDREFRRTNLFHAQIHPAGPLLAYLSQQAFRALGLADLFSDDRLRTLSEDRGLGNCDGPIHPEIIEHFGLEWAPNLSYAHFSEGYFTYDEFIRRYIRFDWIPTYYIAGHLSSLNMLHEAEALLVEVARRPNAPSSVFNLLGDIRRRLGWTEPARAAFIAAAYAPRTL
jgi:hypothetical protein